MVDFNDVNDEASPYLSREEIGDLLAVGVVLRGRLKKSAVGE